MRINPPISSASVGGIRQFLSQIPGMEAMLIGYWVEGQVRTMMTSVMYNSKFTMSDMILRRVIIIPREVFLGLIWGIPVSLLYLSVLGVALMALGTEFDNCGSIHDPVPGLL